MFMVPSISYTALELVVSVLYRSVLTPTNSFEVGPIIGGQVGEIVKFSYLFIDVILEIYGNLRNGWRALCLIGAALIFLCLVPAFFCTGGTPLDLRLRGKLRRRARDSV